MSSCDLGKCVDIEELIPGIYNNFEIDTKQIETLIRAARQHVRVVLGARAFFPEQHVPQDIKKYGAHIRLTGNDELQLTEHSVISLMSTLYPTASKTTVVMLMRPLELSGVIRIDAKKLLDSAYSSLRASTKEWLVREMAGKAALPSYKSAVALKRLERLGLLRTHNMYRETISACSLSRATLVKEINFIESLFLRDGYVSPTDVALRASEYANDLKVIRHDLTARYGVDVWDMVSPLTATMTNVVIGRLRANAV